MAILASGAPKTSQTNRVAYLTFSVGAAELEQGVKEIEFLNKIEALIQKSAKLGGNRVSETLENPETGEG